MMKRACKEGNIPDKVYVIKGSHCDDATMPKSSPTSIAIESWGDPKSAVKVLVTALQLMPFCLRAGFRESPELVGGTDSYPFAGSGQ